MRVILAITDEKVGVARNSQGEANVHVPDMEMGVLDIGENRTRINADLIGVHPRSSAAWFNIKRRAEVACLSEAQAPSSTEDLRRLA